MKLQHFSPVPDPASCIFKLLIKLFIYIKIYHEGSIATFACLISFANMKLQFKTVLPFLSALAFQLHCSSHLRAQSWNIRESTGYYEWNFPNFQFYSHKSSDEDPWIYTTYLKRFRGFGTGFNGGVISRCIGGDRTGLHLGLGISANAQFVEASWSETHYIRHNNPDLQGTSNSGRGGMVALTANIAPSALAAFRVGEVIAGVRLTADKNLFYWLVTNPAILRSSIFLRYKNHSMEAGIASPGKSSPYKHRYIGIHSVLWEYQSFGISYQTYHSSELRNGSTHINDFSVFNIHLGWYISSSIK